MRSATLFNTTQVIPFIELHDSYTSSHLVNISTLHVSEHGDLFLVHCIGCRNSHQTVKPHYKSASTLFTEADSQLFFFTEW